MQARMIFYLRCAVCYRLLPRTRTQNQRAQTHSRRRNYARYDNENQSTALPWSFASSFFYLRRGTAYHACIHFTQSIGALLHAQIYAKKDEKNEEIWLFTPPLTIYKRTAIRRLPTARNSKTVSFFRRWQQCSSSFCIWSREPRCGGFFLTSGSKSKNSLKNRMVQIYNYFAFIHSFSIFKFGSFFNMLICACSTTVILPLAYMHAWYAVPRRKWNKAETNSNERTIVKFSLWPLRLARPRECVWARRFCGRVRGSGRK